MKISKFYSRWKENRKWIYPIGTCDIDSERKCPYRYTIEHRGNLKVDTSTIIKCCRFKRASIQIKRSLSCTA